VTIQGVGAIFLGLYIRSEARARRKEGSNEDVSFTRAHTRKKISDACCMYHNTSSLHTQPLSNPSEKGEFTQEQRWLELGEKKRRKRVESAKSFLRSFVRSKKRVKGGAERTVDPLSVVVNNLLNQTLRLEESDGRSSEGSVDLKRERREGEVSSGFRGRRRGKDRE